MRGVTLPLAVRLAGVEQAFISMGVASVGPWILVLLGVSGGAVSGRGDRTGPEAVTAVVQDTSKADKIVGIFRSFAAFVHKLLDLGVRQRKLLGE